MFCHFPGFPLLPSASIIYRAGSLTLYARNTTSTQQGEFCFFVVYRDRSAGGAHHVYDSYLDGPVVAQNVHFRFEKSLFDLPDSSVYGFPAFYCDCYGDPKPHRSPSLTREERMGLIMARFPHYPYPPPKEQRRNFTVGYWSQRTTPTL